MKTFLQDGSLVYTTAEIVIGELEDVTFRRPVDPDTGYDELLVSAAPGQAAE